MKIVSLPLLWDCAFFGCRGMISGASNGSVRDPTSRSLARSESCLKFFLFYYHVANLRL